MISLVSYQEIFQKAPDVIVRAPGRINLIGEHTDYNDGWVLPGAIDRAIYFAVGARPDDELHFHALDFKESYLGNIKNVTPSRMEWANYLLGVIGEIVQAGKTIQGLNIVFQSDIPIGAGVSSSAALESGVLFAINEIYDLGFDRKTMALMAQHSENTFVGVRCGIMDMFAVLHCKTGHAIKLDCRSLEYELIPFSSDSYQLILFDSQVKHNLAGSDYNTRRSECETGVAILQKTFPEVKALRDVSFEMLEAQKSLFPEIIYKRCSYVVQELQRLEEACTALKNGEMHIFGKLLKQTHAGLRDEYQVSVPELDFLVGRASAFEGCLGARMMGGGFGGCSINLVEEAVAAEFCQTLSQEYREKFGIPGDCWSVKLKEGVQILPLEEKYL